MAYDEGLAERVRAVLAERSDITERKMFGGIAWMVGGNMAVGVIGDDLMVRVGPDLYAGALREPHARPMDFTGRPMTGYVLVGPDGCARPGDLVDWITDGLEFAGALPPKPAKK